MKSGINFLCGALLIGSIQAQAATLKAWPTDARPGDVVTVTIYPAAGETLEGIGMSAWDTEQLKFSMKENNTARAFVGFPFDRHGGAQTLKARVQVTKNGQSSEQILSTVINARERDYPTQRFSMKSSSAGTMNKKDALRKEKIYVQSKMKSSSPTPLWSGDWLVPTQGTPSSPYGRKRWINGKWWGQHNGSDIKAPTGAAIKASNSGRVVMSDYLPDLRGNCVVIDHGCNVFSTYMHMSKRDVKVGDEVARGEVIGKVGATGFVTGAHLHWEMRVGWEPVDPYQFTRAGLKF